MLLDLPQEMQRKLYGKTRPWSEVTGDFADIDGVQPADLDKPEIVRALPVVFMGWYDRKNDDFDGRTYFAHPPAPPSDEEPRWPGDGLETFSREWKQACLERGSLLDTILRLGDNGRESMWEDTRGLRLRPARCGHRSAGASRVSGAFLLLRHRHGH